MKGRIALAVVLLLAPTLAPLGAAGTPQAAAWSPYDAVTTVNDVAIAADGTTVSAALDNPANANTGQVGGLPRVSSSDLTILDAVDGFVYNGSTSGFGRNFTSVSRDGRTIASVGFAATPSPDVRTPDPDSPSGGQFGASAAAMRVYLQRISSGTTWRSDGPATNLSLLLDQGAPVDFLLSEDGTRMVVASNYRGNFTVQGITSNGAQLVSSFLYRVPGTVFDVAGTRDLSRIAVATQVPEGNATYAALFGIPFTFGNPTTSNYDRSQNGTAFVSTAMTPDGSRTVAGTNGGKMLVLDGTTPTSLVLADNATDVRRLTVSADATRLAAVVGDNLTYFDFSSRPRELWNVTVSGKVEEIALNRTGGILLAAVNGTGGGAYAYSDTGPEVLWRFPGSTNAVAIDAAGTRAVYAQRTFVFSVNITREIALTHPGGVDEGATLVVTPGGSATFELDVRNSGAGNEHVQILAPEGFDVTLRTEPALAVVLPDQSKRINVTLTAGPLFQGTQTFNVTAVSTSSSARDETTVTLRLQAQTDVSLVLNGSADRRVVAGEPETLLLGLVNRGSSDLAVGIRAIQSPSQGESWNVTVDPSSLTLAPKSVTTLRATVTPPQGAINGTANTVTFILEGQDLNEQVQVSFRINPTLGVEIDAAGRVKFVEPGKTAHYNVTVTNTGSIPRVFEVFYEVAPQGGKTWAVDMDTRNIPLDAGVSKTIPVRVFAPGDATPSDRVSVLVLTRSVPELENETIETSNVTLFANAVAPKPTTTTPEGVTIPGPSVVAALGAIALLSTILRPRRRAPVSHS